MKKIKFFVIVLLAIFSCTLFGQTINNPKGWPSSSYDGGLISFSDNDNDFVAVINYQEGYAKIHSLENFELVDSCNFKKINNPYFIRTIQFSRTKFDDDLNFETLIFHDNEYEYQWQDNDSCFIKVCDNDGSTIFEFNNDRHILYSSLKVFNNFLYMCIEYKYSDTQTKISTFKVREYSPAILDTIYHNITVTDSIVTIDSLLYLKTDYLLTDKLVIKLSDFSEISGLKSTKVPELVIYPNPTTESINIEIDEEFEGYTFELKTLSGTLLLSQKLSSDITYLSVSDLGLVAGTYLITLRSPKGLQITKKLAVQ